MIKKLINFLKANKVVVLVVVAMVVACVYFGPKVMERFDAEPAPVCVLFHWDKCGHCKSMMPAWNQLGDKVGNVKIKKVEQKDMKKEAPEHDDVQGFPTIKYCPKGLHDKDSCKVFQGERSADALKEFIKSQ